MAKKPNKTTAPAATPAAAMQRIRIRVEMDIKGASREDVFDFPADASEADIKQKAQEFLFQHVKVTWGKDDRGTDA